MALAYGLYTHIQSNRYRSIALLLGLFFLIYVMVYAGALIGEALSGDAALDWLLVKAWRDLVVAWPFATIGTALWVVIAYKFHQVLIDAVTGARAVTRQEEPRLFNALENLCISRGIAMPRLKVMETDALNAFATGLNERQYSITVTRGLMLALGDAELEAVLGHELTHIRNGDVRMMVIAVIIVGVLAFFGEMLFRMFFQSGLSRRPSRRDGDGERKGSGGAIPAMLIGAALVAFAWFFSAMLRFALSRSREFLADAGSVELTKNPDAMIAALRKIEGRGELHGATSAVMELCVDNPREGFVDLFATHPSVAARVDALVRFAGGRDPGPLALPAPDTMAAAPPTAEFLPPGSGPWAAAPDATVTGQPADPPARFLPDLPPIEIGGKGPAGPWRPPAAPSSEPPPGPANPWGPRRDG
jgi:heat shock protein HtpX